MASGLVHRPIAGSRRSLLGALAGAGSAALLGCGITNNRTGMDGEVGIAPGSAAGLTWLPDRPNPPFAAAVQLPAYAHSAQVAEAYRYAVERPDLLRYVPCYCGCASEGHMDNLACFVKGTGEDGAVLFDRHGSACGICVLIAQETKRLAAQGVPLPQIRRQGYHTFSSSGLGTHTPLPPST